MNVLLLITILAAPPTAEVKDDPVAVVKQAAAAYRGQDFKAAGALFRKAYDLTQVPNQLRNAAKAYQDGALWTEALQTWALYRAIDGIEPSAIAEADAQMALIRQQQATHDAQLQADAARREAEAAKKAQAEAEARAAAAAVAPPPAPPPPLVVHTPAPEPAPAYGAYVTLGVGAAAAITAGALYLHGNGRLETLDGQLAATNGAGEIVGVDRVAAIAELDGINAERNAAAILGTIGMAAVITGVVWLVLDDDEEDDS